MAGPSPFPAISQCEVKRLKNVKEINRVWCEMERSQQREMVDCELRDRVVGSEEFIGFRDCV